MTRFPLFTSIKPPATTDELSYLTECINSWSAVGFEPISLNGSLEISSLERLNLPIQFVTLPLGGKPKISDFFALIKQRDGAQFAGIINSDCKIIRYTNFATNLASCLKDRAMLAWRIDIGCDESPKAEPYGLDAFFFDVECTPQEDCGFTIGAAWWDTWFPVALAIAGADVGKLDVPLLTHKRHPTTWDDEAWFAGVGRGWQMLRNYEFSPLADLRASWRHKETLSKHQLAKISDRIINWIQARNFSVNVLASDMADIEMALHLGGKAMLQHERALAIENSTTWRATAPLRSAINSLRFRSRVLLSQRG